MTNPAIGILAIGSELLAGDTLNTNASWMSQRLRNLGRSVKFHLVVDDNMEEILSALKFLRDYGCRYIFVSGGLGPTSDDITRDGIARFINRPLEFNEASWQKIVAMLSSRGVPVASTNKRQAFFPAGVSVITNDQGTADGFHVVEEGVHFWVLPGPPKELQPLWKKDIEPALIATISSKKEWRVWHTIGFSESALGELVERLNLEGIDIAYQSHAPYVRLKAHFESNHAAALQAKLDSLTNLVREKTIFMDDRDPFRLLRDQLEGRKSLIIDAISGGYFLQRVGEQAGGEFPQGFCYELMNTEDGLHQTFLDRCQGFDFALAIFPTSAEGVWQAMVHRHGQTATHELVSPYDFKIPPGRAALVATELAVARVLESQV